jgi:hypothetical protein
MMWLLTDEPQGDDSCDDVRYQFMAPVLNQCLYFRYSCYEDLATVSTPDPPLPVVSNPKAAAMPHFGTRASLALVEAG